MKIKPLLSAACLALAFVGSALAQALPPVVEQAFQRAEIPPFAIGAYVQEIGGPVVMATNWDVPFNPASTMKLVTSNAGLELLGPTFTWKTEAYASGRLTGEVLHGDLVIKGGGDPKLVLENFWMFLRRIRERGIREIHGDLVLDRSIFEDLPYDAAAFDGDPMKPYNVGPDALLLNYKSLGFRFLPDEHDKRVRAVVDPPLAGFSVSAPRLVSGECGDWRARLQPSIDGSGARFEGVYSLACGERAWYVHPYQLSHEQYFGAVFRRMWAELGGKLVGTVRNGHVPADAKLVAEWQSPPLSDLIRDINKFSNNVMARQLLLTIANQALKLPATPERGAAVVKTWLAAKGIDAPELSIENGSGLSRSERISALTLARLLIAAYQAPTMPEFMSSMALVGYDGTMRKRLNGHGVAGQAHIKTGALNDVRAVAGYILAASGKRYVVVCLVNHANAPRAREAQDALLQWVYERG